MNPSEKKWLTKVFAVVLFAVGGSVWALQSGSGSMNTEPNKDTKLVWVLNNDAVDHEAGDVLVWADSTYDGVTVATTTSANSKLMAGVVPYGYTLPASGWGWMQVYGYHPAITVVVANSAGDCLGTSTTAEGTTVTTTVGACGAVALEATTSSTTVKGFIRSM